MNTSHPPLEVLYWYHDSDHPSLTDLETHLEPLKKVVHFNTWHRGMIGAGKVQDVSLREHYNTASVILLLISPRFMASEHYTGPEMQEFMRRHEKEEVLIIPILVRSATWNGATFARFVSLPTDKKPIAERQDRDVALVEIANEIKRAVESMRARREAQISTQKVSANEALIHQQLQEARSYSLTSTVGLPPKYQYKIDQSFLVEFNLRMQYLKFYMLLEEQLVTRYHGTITCSITAQDYYILKKYILKRMILELQRRNRRKSILLDEVSLEPDDLSEDGRGIEEKVLSQFEIANLATLLELENTYEDIILVLWHNYCPTRLVQAPARAFEQRLKQQIQHILERQNRCLLLLWTTVGRAGINRNITLPPLENFNIDDLKNFSSEGLKDQLKNQGATEDTINGYINRLKNIIDRYGGRPIETYQNLEDFIAAI